MRTIRNNYGFTIVELLIVIVVITILAIVTVVAFNGVQQRAQQSQVLSSVDSYEKALKLHKAENNYYPDDTRGLGASAPINLGENIEKTGIGCLGSNYPSNDIFREGECLVLLVSVTDGESTGTTRLATMMSPEINSALSPQIVSKLPPVPTQILKYSSKGTGIIQGGQEVDATVTIAYRGLIFQAQGYSESTRELASVLVGYFVKGDQSCGRGNKIILDFTNLSATGTELENITLDPGSGSPLWTSCMIILD